MPRNGVAAGLVLFLFSLAAFASPAIVLPAFASPPSSACGQTKTVDSLLFGGYCVAPRNPGQTITGANMSYTIPYASCLSGVCDPIVIVMIGFWGCTTLGPGCSFFTGFIIVNPPAGDFGGYAPANPGDSVQIGFSSVPGGYLLIGKDLQSPAAGGSALFSTTSPLAGVFFGITSFCGNCVGPEPIPQFGSVSFHASIDFGSGPVPLKAMSVTQYVLVGGTTGGVTAQPTKLSGYTFSVSQLSTEQ